MARECFRTDLPVEVMTKLATTEPAPGLSRRFAQSNLGLLLDDWKRLPNRNSRMALLRELFLPPAESLSQKYGPKPRFLLPFLYLRHVLGGLAARLTLR